MHQEIVLKAENSLICLEKKVYSGALLKNHKFKRRNFTAFWHSSPETVNPQLVSYSEWKNELLTHLLLWRQWEEKSVQFRINKIIRKLMQLNHSCFTKKVELIIIWEKLFKDELLKWFYRNLILLERLPIHLQFTF